MKYLVFVIYVYVVGQLLRSKPKSTNKGSVPKGRNFYKLNGVINSIFGFAGMIAINQFLRDKGIIPEMFVWIALVGFLMVALYGMYCMVMMMVSMEP